MSSLLFIVSLLITVGNSCSIAQLQFGTYYISNVQLLDAVQYPDQVLLTISRTTEQYPATIGTRPRLTFDDSTGGPWCKIMNVHDGSVGNVVNCDDYASLTRNYASVDVSSTSVTCQDNCDGETATCVIIRNRENLTLSDIPFPGSDNTSCTDNKNNRFSIAGFYTAFTNEEIFTTYIIFNTNTVGIVFDDSTIPVTTQIINVQRVGDWSYALPGGWGYSPRFYYDVDVLSVQLPCCLCYGAAYSKYTIEEAGSESIYDQVFTLYSIGDDTRIDVIKERGIKADTAFNTAQITIYDLSDASSVTFEPDLCDVIVNCFVDPCQSSTCAYNPTATCVADYCGGCNARWFVLCLCIMYYVYVYVY